MEKAIKFFDVILLSLKFCSSLSSPQTFILNGKLLLRVNAYICVIYISTKSHVYICYNYIRSANIVCRFLIRNLPAYIYNKPFT